MLDYSIIYNEIIKTENINKTTQEIKDIFNAKTDVDYVYTDKTIINNYLSNNNILIFLGRVIKADKSPSIDTGIPEAGGLTLREICQAGVDFYNGNTGDKVNPYNANLRGMITILQATQVLSASLVNGFWELFKVYRCRAELELNVSEISDNDVEYGRNYTKISSLNNLRQFLVIGYNSAISKIEIIENNLTLNIPTKEELLESFEV